MTPATLQKLQGLAEPLRTRVAALLERTGDAVWIVSGRRSIEEQIQLRRAHCGTSYDDVWNKPSSQCSPPTARPGFSNHEKGMAVDLGGDMALAGRLAAQVGLDRPVRGENWHFEVDDDAATAQLLGGDPTGGVLGGAIGIFGGQLEDAVGGALGKLVEPFLGGMRRIALTGLLVAGGVVLVVLGGIRGTNEQIERKLT